MYGGAIRGGKSYVGIGLLIALCKLFPGSRWAVVRKDLPRLRRNTIPIYDKIRPDRFIGTVNKVEWKATATNGSEILFVPESIKDDPDLDRWKGLEVNGFLFEEANEMAEKTFFKAQERMGTWIIPNTKRQPPSLILSTCNPARNWVKRTFYDAWRSGAIKRPYFYLPANVTDNPYLSQEYLDDLKNLPKAEYERFVLGNWDAADDPEQLIKYEWVLAAKGVEKVPGKRSMGVDVARFGDDSTVFAMMDGNELESIEPHDGLAIDQTADRAQAIMTDREKPIGADQVKIDAVGLGAGVVDILRKAGFAVVEVLAGAKATKDGVPGYPGGFRYYNLRSQLWFEMREKFRTGQIYIPDMPSRLIEDLTAPKYSISGEKVLRVESKDDIKKRLGRSPDYADALMQALYEPPVGWSWA